MELIELISNIDWNSIGALLMLYSGFASAAAARRKKASEIVTDALDVASKSVGMREKDIDYLRTKATSLEERIDFLNDYIDYLLWWIDQHVTKKIRPKKIDNFKLRRKKR